jgi:hypothetical protein
VFRLKEKQQEIDNRNNMLVEKLEKIGERKARSFKTIESEFARGKSVVVFDNPYRKKR